MDMREHFIFFFISGKYLRPATNIPVISKSRSCICNIYTNWINIDNSEWSFFIFFQVVIEKIELWNSSKSQRCPNKAHNFMFYVEILVNV